MANEWLRVFFSAPRDPRCHLFIFFCKTLIYILLQNHNKKLTFPDTDIITQLSIWSILRCDLMGLLVVKGFMPVIYGPIWFNLFFPDILCL